MSTIRRLRASAVEALLGRARQLVADGSLAACQLALGLDGEVAVFETYGDADANTRFTLFSATKPITSAAVWQLIGEGLVDLEMPVAAIIPEFATNGKNRVTLAQVMLHTGGFPRQPFDDRDLRSSATRRATLSRWELEWEPGTRYEYHANTAHWVLAEIIETVRGDDYRAVVEERVTRPAGIGRRVLGIPRDQQDGIAVLDWTGSPNPGLNPGDGIGLTPEMFLRYNDPEIRELGPPAGGAAMTAAELALLYQAFLHNPNRTWSPEILRDATTNIRNRLLDSMLGTPANRTIAFVIEPGPPDGSTPGRFGHGGTGGQVAWADPASGLSFAFLTSSLDRDLMVWMQRPIELSRLAAACAP